MANKEKHNSTSSQTLSGHFENCYGIKDFKLTEMNFTESNVALIYAPNGTMKTSLAKTFEDLSKGSKTKDRVYEEANTSYLIKYNGNDYIYPSKEGNSCKASDVYVINSYDDTLEFTRENVNTLLADDDIRNEYNSIIDKFSDDIKQVETKLNELSGLSKNKIKETLIEDFDLNKESDWTDIFGFLNNSMEKKDGSIAEIRYIDVFNDKTIKVFDSQDFKCKILEYIEQLDKLLSNSVILNKEFNDRCITNLTKSISSNDLFSAGHKIVLKNEVTISSLKEWKDIVEEETEKLYEQPELKDVFEKINKILVANNETSKLRNILADNKNIIPFLVDIKDFKKMLWLNYFGSLEQPFKVYYDKISSYSKQIKDIYQEASKQSEIWKNVLDEFNRRFKVPFKAKITNKANFLLKDETPNVMFDYSNGIEESQEVSEDQLNEVLSMGEKRALYLLHILFDIQRIKEEFNDSNNRCLIIADDIADSFDYKNKFAIVEYLRDISIELNVNLLVLTHNFDFYRSLTHGLDARRENCFIIEKDDKSNLYMGTFKYRNDFFKKVIIEQIKDGKLDTDNKKKCLIASIPFYRNLEEYSLEKENYEKLTCFIHFKTKPLNTSNLTLDDLWGIINDKLEGNELKDGSCKYLDEIVKAADEILNKSIDEVSLENKIVLSMAIRLIAEKHMKKVIEEKGNICDDATKNQTREWFEKSKGYLPEDQQKIIEDILLITPESIHLNSFMYEPLIDISNWSLIKLYRDVKDMACV